jgi:hypothetical protein
MKKFTTYLFSCGALLWLFILAFSCDISKNDIKPAEGFTKIYDLDSAQYNHHAIDIEQMPDGGYLFLGYDLQEQASTIIVRVDNEGKVKWQKNIQTYFNPISDLMKLGNEYYFVSSRAITFEMVVLKVNDINQQVEEVASLNENKRPLAACATPDNGILIQTYDFIDNQTVIIKLGADFQLDASFSNDGKESFEVSEPDLMNERIDNHLTFQGDRLPFFVSYIKSNTGLVSYVFNGVNKYDISLTAISPSTGGIKGSFDGFRYKKVATTYTDLGNGSAAIAKFDGIFNYFSPSVKLNDLVSGQIFNISDLEPAIKRPEIVAGSEVRSQMLNINGRNVVVYVADLANNKIGLYVYDASNGAFIGQKYLGYSFATKLGSITTTNDGGMAILCQTLVSGRFGRLCLFKLSKAQVEEFIK